MFRSKFLLCMVCVFLFLSACSPQQSPVAAPSPTDRIQSLPQNLPTLTLAPTLTPAPTRHLLTPTSLYNATATVPVLYTAVPTPGTDTPSLSRNILLYDDMPPELGLWVKQTADKMQLDYTLTIGSGELLKALQSDTKWGLIIVASENKSAIQGDLWDLLTAKVITDKSSLISEMWNTDQIYQGKVKSFLDTCGVVLGQSPDKAVPIYLTDPQNPIFNTPNSGISLEKPIPYWQNQAIDYLNLSPNSTALILASGAKDDKVDKGVIVSCFAGRVILQTFLNHDYPEPTIKALWENYITYMLSRK